MNPLYELRDRMHLSRVQFGKLVKKSKATIEKYESEISPQFAGQLATLATKHGHADLAMLFKIAAGKKRPPEGMDLTVLSPDEIEFLKGCLALYRKPGDEYGKSVVTIVKESIKLRQSDA